MYFFKAHFPRKITILTTDKIKNHNTSWASNIHDIDGCQDIENLNSIVGIRGIQCNIQCNPISGNSNGKPKLKVCCDFYKNDKQISGSNEQL